MLEVLEVIGPRLQHLTVLSEEINSCMIKGEVGYSEK